MSLAPLRIFLSSSVYGLEPLRAMVEETLLSLQQLPVGMEHFYAQPGGAIAISNESVAECDIYVGIIAWRYGTIKPGETKSITHLEYEEAVAREKPRYLYLAMESTRTDLTLYPAATRDPEHEAQLLAFRTYLQQNEVVSYFDSATELGRQVSIGVSRELQKRAAMALNRPQLLVPRVLPPQIPNFVGRDDALDRLCAQLRGGESVGLSAVVVGMGGIGKSTLAAQALQRLADEPAAFPGGIGFVPCNQKTEMDGLAAIYDQILTLWNSPLSPEEAARASTPALAADLRETALRTRLALAGRALLLLDNVERDLPLDRLVGTLTGVGLTVLVTSRFLPASPRLTVTRLDVLAPDPARALFRERFTARGGTWYEDRDAVATLEVVRGLGYLPLAIELAAARAALRPLTPTDLAQELREPGVLAKLADPIDLTASVRYALEQSLATLTETERAQFASLSLLQGPDAPRVVAEAVIAAVGGEGTDGGAMLDRLAAFSLVEVFTLPADAGGSYRQRARFHPLLLELAGEQWKALAEAVQVRGIEALLAVLIEVVDGYGEDIISEAREETLIAEAIRRAAQRQVGVREYRDLIWDWDTYLDRGGHWQLYAELLSIRLRASLDLRDRGGEAATYTDLGLLAHNQGRYAEANDYYTQSLAIWQELGNRTEEGQVLGNLGNLAADQRQNVVAVDYSRQTLAIARELGNRQTEAKALNNLGLLLSEEKQYMEAFKYYAQSLVIVRELGDRLGEDGTLGNLGGLAFVQERYSEAADFFAQSLTIFQEFGDQRGVAKILYSLGSLSIIQRRLDDAERYFIEALALFSALDMPDAADARTALDEIAELRANSDSAFPQDEADPDAEVRLPEPEPPVVEPPAIDPSKRGFWPWQRRKRQS